MLIAASSVLRAFGLTAPTYAFQISVIAQGPSRQASAQESAHAENRVQRWINATPARSALSTSQMQAISTAGTVTHNWITIAHYTVTGHHFARLEQLEQFIKTRSPWRVTDINRGGEFVQVAVRPGVTTLRLSELVGTADSSSHVRLQVSGPSAAFSIVDALPLCFLAFVVLSFGARRMSPAAVFCYIVTFALFVSTLIVYV